MLDLDRDFHILLALVEAARRLITCDQNELAQTEGLVVLEHFGSIAMKLHRTPDHVHEARGSIVDEIAAILGLFVGAARCHKIRSPKNGIERGEHVVRKLREHLFLERMLFLDRAEGCHPHAPTIIEHIHRALAREPAGCVVLCDHAEFKMFERAIVQCLLNDIAIFWKDHVHEAALRKRYELFDRIVEIVQCEFTGKVKRIGLIEEAAHRTDCYIGRKQIVDLLPERSFSSCLFIGAEEEKILFVVRTVDFHALSC